MSTELSISLSITLGLFVLNILLKIKKSPLYGGGSIVVKTLQELLWEWLFLTGGGVMLVFLLSPSQVANSRLAMDSGLWMLLVFATVLSGLFHWQLPNILQNMGRSDPFSILKLLFNSDLWTILVVISFVELLTLNWIKDADIYIQAWFSHFAIGYSVFLAVIGTVTTVLRAMNALDFSIKGHYFSFILINFLNLALLVGAANVLTFFILTYLSYVARS